MSGFVGVNVLAHTTKKSRPEISAHTHTLSYISSFCIAAEKQHLIQYAHTHYQLLIPKPVQLRIFFLKERTVLKSMLQLN